MNDPLVISRRTEGKCSCMVMEDGLLSRVSRCFKACFKARNSKYLLLNILL